MYTTEIIVFELVCVVKRKHFFPNNSLIATLFALEIIGFCMKEGDVEVLYNWTDPNGGEPHLLTKRPLYSSRTKKCQTRLGLTDSKAVVIFSLPRSHFAEICGKSR